MFRWLKDQVDHDYKIIINEKKNNKSQSTQNDTKHLVNEDN